MAKLLDHFKAMQAMAAAYVEPSAYVSRDGHTALNQDDRNRLFANDMLYMLDGPEERVAVREAENNSG